MMQSRAREGFKTSTYPKTVKLERKKVLSDQTT